MYRWNAFFAVCITVSLGMPVLSADSDNDPSYIDKFHAQPVVHTLQRSNLEKIEFIEVIAKNFGYTDTYNLRKDYWSARLLVIKGDIVGARKMLEKNREDIDKTLLTLSKQYRVDAQKILDECSLKMSEMKLEVEIGGDPDEHDRLDRNNSRIRIAYDEFHNAVKASTGKQYQPSINLFRHAKRQAINILEDLAGPNERHKVVDKYKIHIVDNRQEVFKKS
ncbi:MAG: hypothetical protein CVV44_08935 [Spirochaetae bacterium HGW-Spirochaetae-1]|nr:MAG: hypothetical protein CVV44_08935 [Spirochaetae bacterium HGW-Spirochaetae-1]